ncbi:hypothetical protein [Legionella waltersii]|uniref:Dot/Icm T4SS effector n=1 Tax=Legionella waltersii TaxID=66969 RepID=A0A0W1AMZ5_9GAMM|nr:hypothetical protein [Legionella waltersii]KTD82600.1 Dot/Icm T4SS effector [Legionella waltersii]SNV02673.1 Dot/Icm T4SS effector [Legionella waltersii]
MYTAADKTLQALNKELYWSLSQVRELLLAKQIRRAESGRPFSAYVLQHDQNVQGGHQNPNDSFHQFLNFVAKNIEQFENESCMQMIVHDGRAPGHWTNFSLMIKDSKIHVFACDSADDTPGEDSLIELQKILGDKANIYKLHPDKLPDIKGPGARKDPRRLIQSGNFECSRMALYNAELLAKAGSGFFKKLMEMEPPGTGYETLLDNNLQMKKEHAVGIDTSPELAKIKLVRPQVAVRILPALYGVTQSWKRLNGIVDADPQETIGNSGRNLRGWAEYHSKTVVVDGEKKKQNFAIMDKASKMVEHLGEMRAKNTPSELEKLSNVMQDWTQSAPLKGVKHPIQPSLSAKVERVLDKLIDDCSKQIEALKEKERGRPLHERFTSKTKRFVTTGHSRSETRQELYDFKKEVEQLKVDLLGKNPTTEGLRRKLNLVVNYHRVSPKIISAIKSILPKMNADEIVQFKRKLPAASEQNRRVEENPLQHKC